VTTVIADATIGAGGNEFFAAYCPDGLIASGGGYIVSDPAVAVVASYPETLGTGWVIHAVSSSAIPETVTTYAMCVEGIASTTGP